MCGIRGGLHSLCVFVQVFVCGGGLCLCRCECVVFGVSIALSVCLSLGVCVWGGSLCLCRCVCV